MNHSIPAAVSRTDGSIMTDSSRCRSVSLGPRPFLNGGTNGSGSLDMTVSYVFRGGDAAIGQIAGGKLRTRH